MSINKVVISGNLTRDPELRQTANGFPLFSVSAWRSTTVARTSRRASGKITPISSTARCSALAQKRFSLLEQRLQGCNRRESFAGPSGNAMVRSAAKIEVVCRRIEFMTARGEGGNMGMPHMSAPASAYALDLRSGSLQPLR